jgi:hypothetical protein
MRTATALVLALAVLGLIAVVAVALAIERTGTDAVPAWAGIASPGPLSSSHAFLERQCESCHAPNRGITAVACIGCHTADMAGLAMQSTAFHADIQACGGCHIEHRGPAVRPTQMDHAVLARIGWGQAERKEESKGAATEALPEWRHAWARLVGRHGEDDVASLDCFACHGNRNPHRDGQSISCCGARPAPTVGSLFGRDCAACHAVESWKIAGYQHPSPRSQDCAQCHAPPPSHHMMHFAMVSMTVSGQMHARVDQCYLCHQTDSWNDIKGAGWYKHH